ncbi:MAG: metallophosphoesterase [Methanobrevibacter sp.]|uniref:metallophosphoesterase n=1 Tax=Methanobrevibacter sp. TaxID=66852 RepID=UPI0025EC0917|nr:metallophosphoesterase [Methanobrevibacter sp.]MBR0272111.1 metallophosphoesterase [Methanobrevibacter sp.]
MSFRTRRVTFMTPFYMLFEFFLLKFLFMLFYPLDDLTLLSITVLIGILNVAPMLLEEKKTRFVTRLLTEISAIWMWASLMFMIDITIIYLIGNLDQNIIYAMLLAVPLIGIYAYYKAHKLVIKHKEVKLDNLEREINIVHLSDVHFGAVRYKKIISQVKDTLDELSATCDVAIISGDLADGSSLVAPDDFLPLKDVEMPIIFTPGNHDYYPGIRNVIEACRNAGIIVLDNESVEISGVNIYGLTYSFGDIEMPTLDELKSEIKQNKTNIIVYHVPYAWDIHSKIGFDIQLSGHTHGGQFYPVTWISDRMFEYNRGLFRDNSGHYLNVTTGVGSMDQPLRWGTDSEVVVLKLKKN